MSDTVAIILISVLSAFGICIFLFPIIVMLTVCRKAHKMREEIKKELEDG